jgi:septal ring factor EnvC (AmiA/AmiB activator)
MTRTGRAIRTGFVCAFAAGILVLGGCTKYASPDDLKKLDAADKAAVSAERDVEKAKAERRGLEKQLSDKKSELAAAKTELEQVKNR